jgi:hypothetical protein
VLAVRNQEGGCPYCIVEDVLIEGNTIKDVGTAVSTLGRDTNHRSQTMRNITFRENTVDNLNQAQSGGRGTVFEILRGPEDLTIEGTQVVNSPLTVHSALFFGGGSNPAIGLVARGNRFIEGQYGIIGDGSLNATRGAPALGAYAPGFVWDSNTVVRSGIRVIAWPAGTTSTNGRAVAVSLPVESHPRYTASVNCLPWALHSMCSSSAPATRRGRSWLKRP